MTESEDRGVIIAMLRRMKDIRLPRALELKKSVDAGECLSDHDLAFLHRVFDDAKRAQTLISRHPEYQGLVGQMTTLYGEITSRALENEKNR